VDRAVCPLFNQLLAHYLTNPVKRRIITVPIRKIDGESVSTEQDLVAVEEPLEIVVNGRNLAVTMRTPGHDRELAAGFLFTEGIVQNRSQIAAISVENNRVELSITSPADFVERRFYLTSSCGVCGKASIEALESIGCPFLDRAEPRIARDLISRLPARLRSGQSAFDHTGGLHAAGLFDAAGNLLYLNEDIGRHNAVDKIIGAALLSGETPLNRHILMLSGRAGFELIQKALMAGIAIVAAVGAPSSLAVETALRYGMTLAGFVRNARFNVYSGPERLNDGLS
jgi:FdhD protein